MVRNIGKASLVQNGIIKVVESEGVPYPDKNYLAIWGGGGNIYAFQYFNGIYQDQLAVKSLSGTSLSTPIQADIVLISIDPLVIVLMYSGPRMLVWNITTNTFFGPSLLPVSGLQSHFGLSSGKDGFGYWVKGRQGSGTDWFELWRVDDENNRVRITPSDAEGEIPELGFGSYISTALWNGTHIYVPVFGFDPFESGYVRAGADQTIFVPSEDFLPGSASDWSLFNNVNTNGNNIPGTNDSFHIGVLDPIFISAILNNDSPPSDVFITESNTLGIFPIASDPSIDGETVMLTDLDKITQVYLNTIQDVVLWHDIESAPPVSDVPGYFFCMD